MIAFFTTDPIRRSQRIEFWRRFVCDHVADVDCWVEGSDDFQGRINTYAFGRTSLSLLSADPHQVGRARDRIARARNDYFLVIFQLQGCARYAQNGCESRLGRGDFVLYEPRLPYQMSLPERFEHITLRLPRNALANLSRELPEIVGRPVRASSAGGELVGCLLRAVLRRIADMPLDTTFGYAESMVDLVVHAIWQEAGGNTRPLRSPRGYTLARVKQFILGNLHCSDLSLAQVSDRVGVSERQIARLFRAEGLSPGQWIKSIRLERCAAALVDSSTADLSISQIAFSAGFGDLSHFCRDFKGRYGVTPSQYRREFPSGPDAQERN